MRNNSIYIKEANQYVKVAFDEIAWIEANENHCYIYTIEKTYTVQYALEKLIEKFPLNQFIRIHSRFSINIKHMVSVDLVSDSVLLMDKQLPLGKSYRDHFMKNLNCI